MLSCPQGGLGDGGRDPGDSWDLWGSEAGDPQNLSGRRPGWVGERNSQRTWRGMISAPLPSPGAPRSSAHPKTCKFTGKDPSRWIPAKGGRSSSTIQEVPAAPSLPWVGKGTGTRDTSVGWKELPTPQHKLGKGNIGREGMEEVMGASRTHQERVRKTVTGSRGARLGYGEGSSLHPAQKKISETPPKPTPDTLNTTQHFPVGDGKAATSPVLPF